MIYTDEYICESYRRARRPKDQIIILAQLNATTPSEIRKVLSRNGLLDTCKNAPVERQRYPKWEKQIRDAESGKVFCATCGAPFDGGKNGNARYCPDCRKKRDREHKRLGKRAAREKERREKEA